MLRVRQSQERDGEVDAEVHRGEARRDLGDEPVDAGRYVRRRLGAADERLGNLDREALPPREKERERIGRRAHSFEPTDECPRIGERSAEIVLGVEVDRDTRRRHGAGEALHGAGGPQVLADRVIEPEERRIDLAPADQMRHEIRVNDLARVMRGADGELDEIKGGHASSSAFSSATSRIVRNRRAAPGAE
jgi:hypothetical protein